MEKGTTEGAAGRKCIGLEDCNGVEIREGDIVESEKGHRMVVAYCQVDGKYKMASIKALLRNSDRIFLGIWWEPISWYMLKEYRFRVIGNRYDNPEMLEGK